jgi:ATP synthase protein I
MGDEDSAFARQVAAKAARKLKARREGNRTVWFGLGMIGVIGWSLAAPTLLGAMLGHWWDRRHPGVHSWTLVLMLAGLAVGCVNAWHWVSREDKAIHRESDDDE